MIENPPPWPDGKRCAVAFSFDMDADSVVQVNSPGQLDQQLHALAQMRYDPLVAVPRLTKLFAAYNIPVSFFVPGWVIERYPGAVAGIVEHGNEIAHHGYLHEWPTKQTPGEQRDTLERGSELIESISGQRPSGYRAPYYGINQQTIDLLIEFGFEYESSLFADDVPLVLRTKEGSLIEIPIPDSVDDYNQYVSSRAFDYLMTISPPRQALEVFQAEFDAMWEFGGLWVGVWHPAVSGRLSRALAIRQLIEHMCDKGDVWFATHEQIARHTRQLIDSGQWQPRVDDLPLYDDPLPEAMHLLKK
jgi:peptidoglycan/xylan/chitin deacetylase (PgdA/CDA1 family)